MKEHERAAIERAEKLTAELEKSPILRKQREEEAAATLSKRTEAAGKIEVLKTEMDAAIPKLQAVLAVKEKNYLTSKVALDNATNEFNTARAALSRESQSFGSSISTQEQIMIESADPLIDEAITFFREKFDWLRQPRRISQNALEGKKNIFTETKTVTTESNADAVQEALQYCMAAIRALEGMKLIPSLDIQKIEELKKGIPDIGVYTEITVEKPNKGINPSFLANMANEFDKKIEKLLRK